MTITAQDNDFGDIKRDCEEWLGRIPYFVMLDNIHIREQRIGQAFMNALPLKDWNTLVDTPADPSHRDDWDAIHRALDYLLEHG